MLSILQRTFLRQPSLEQQWVRHLSGGGVDTLRQLLRQHSQEVSLTRTPGGNVLKNVSNGGDAERIGATSRVVPEHTGLLDKSNRQISFLVKDLLRIFTRKVPGGLVPDGLIHGFIQAYRDLKDPGDRLAFLRLVISEMGLSVAEVNSAVRAWTNLIARGPLAPTTAPAAPHTSNAATAAPDALRGAAPALAPARDWSPRLPHPALPPPPAEVFHEAAYRAADRLASACQPLYTQLFLPVSQAPEGMKFLVDLRADLLELAAQQSAPAASAPLRAMADHLRQSLADWFSVGLLHLQRISWEESPAALLERVIRYEAVHPLGSWDELRQRLGPQRRVFAFTHPSMPGEPLVLLHTALMNKPASCLSEILRQPEPPGAEANPSEPYGFPAAAVDAAAGASVPSPPHAWRPTTAVFYSISSSQPGLRGIELGHFLIKRVAERLLAENPTIRQLVTLSPLPNFRAWLVSRLRQELQQHHQQPQHQPLEPGKEASQRDLGSQSGGEDSGVHAEAPMLTQREAAAVVHLARGLGWTPPPGPTAPANSSPGGAGAAMALLWLLDNDRWLFAKPEDSGGTAAEVAAVMACGGGQRGVGAALIPAVETGPPAEVGGSVGGNGEPEQSAELSATKSGDRPGGPRPGLGSDVARGATDAEGSMVEDSARSEGQDEWRVSVEAVLRPVLMRLAASYLAVEKRRRFALCPVAHFHLRNGASLWRLNWRADTSQLGLQRSFGIMVNYDYNLEDVYDNNRKYLLAHEVQAHARVLRLLMQLEDAV